MRRTFQYLAVGVLMCAGCVWQHTLSVTLSPGYKGKVLLSCRSLRRADVQVQVGPSGMTAGMCPSHKAKLRVYRDGKEVSPQDVTWMTTGDDYMTGLAFTVR
jgi:hypothetical protein